MATSENDFYREAFNAHEQAESVAMDAMRSYLAAQSSETLMCLADPQWHWETRSWISAAIIDCADDILTVRLNTLMEA